MPGSSTHSKIRPKKRFGQNFLIDQGVIDSIIGAADIKAGDTILEIGPGRGALTKHLVRMAKRLVAIEIDWDLAAILRDEFLEYDNIEIIEGDVLKFNLNDIFSADENVKVVANLPYYITTPIIMKLLEEGVTFERMIVMVQKEVALRMCAKAGSPDYGALSLAVGYYTNPSIVCPVPSSSFRPAPKVDSAVVMLSLKEQILEEKERVNLFKCVKAAFSQRRKTMVNALNSGGFGTKDEIKRILKDLGFNDNIRGEALSLEDYIMLSKKLGDTNGR